MAITFEEKLQGFRRGMKAKNLVAIILIKNNSIKINRLVNMDNLEAEEEAIYFESLESLPTKKPTPKRKQVEKREDYIS